MGIREPIFMVAFCPSVARMRGILQNLGVGVGEQQIQRGRADGHGKIGGLEMGEIVERGRGTGGGRAGGARGAARGRWCWRWRLQRDTDAAGPGDAQGPLPVLAHLQDGDVHHHLGARLVQVVDELLRQQQLVGRAAHHDGVLAGARRRP